MTNMKYITDQDRQEAIIERLEAIERALNPPPKPDINQLIRDEIAERNAHGLAPLADSIARHATKGKK